VTGTTQVAVLAPLGHEAGSGRQTATVGERPLVRLIAFAALGFYGVLRWATLMNPAPLARLLGLLALAVALAGLGPIALEREREVAIRAGRRAGGRDSSSSVGAPLAVVAALLALPLAGIPLAWVVHLRVAVTANGIGEGLSALPGILVPYAGLNEWARTVIVLGAAVLLLDAAMLLAFAPPGLGDMRRVGAALPLIAMVVVPATLVHPHFAYLQGLTLFALLAFFLWGERVPADRRGGVILACGATGAIGMIIGPALDQHSPWINYEALTRGFTPAHVERFDWTQRYGPLNWPRTGNDVLYVKASPGPFPGEYWKAENLDSFDGTGWTAGAPGSGTALTGVSASTLRRYTQTLTVTINAMNTNQVIEAGYAELPPQHLPGPPQRGSSLGTWTSPTTLNPGDTYTVRVYAPHPTGARLAQAGTDYAPDVRSADLWLTMPQQGGAPANDLQLVRFAPFGSPAKPRDLSGSARLSGTAAIDNSPYRQAYETATALARKSSTPYAFVQKVMAYLSGANGYTYDEFPPLSPFPLETFLFYNRIGYCQQFAGAMALLLRMGGVPARVSTGFTTGAYDTANKRWLVSDVDAHAWVEVWFPRYGWVTFDPTPAAAPARGGSSQVNPGDLSGSSSSFLRGIRRAETPVASVGPSGAAHASSSAAPELLAALAVLIGLVGLGLVVWRRARPLDADGMLAELERALARSGRPISDGVTLAGLERRFRNSPEAAAYLRTLRLHRFGAGGALPTLRQRRALRAQLRAGLGLGGALRAVWALPPRPNRGASGRRGREHRPLH
jgi:transglutaminase-like putative cysteine protease